MTTVYDERNDKNICEKMTFHKWLNVNKIKNIQQILLWSKLRKCRKWLFFLHDLRKNTIFVNWKCLSIKCKLSPFFARVRKEKNKFQICEKSKTCNILDLRALWKININNVPLLPFSKGGICEICRYFNKDFRHKHL